MPVDNDPVNRIIDAICRGVRCLIVRGAAGTGKTTLVRNLIPALRAHGFSPSLLAPTGRAALMLRNRTGHGASTIHSAIYNVHDEPQVNDDGEALKWIFPLRVEDDVEDTVFVVDEASMIGFAKHENDRELLQFGSGSLLGDLVEYSGIRVPDTTNVLVFVGDPCQLPPVQESTAHVPPALDERKLAELVQCPVEVVELRTVHRQKAGSGILSEACKLRDCLEQSDFNYFRCEPHPDVIIEEADRFLDAFDPRHDLDDKIVIAHTNLRVDEYNRAVRQRLGLTAELPRKGERLLSLRNTQLMTPGGGKVAFLNGDFLRVEEVDDNLFHLEGFYRPKGQDKRYHFSFTWCRMVVSWVYEPERRRTEPIWVNVSPILSTEWNEHPQYASVGLYNGVKAHIEQRLRAFGKPASHDVVKRMLKESVLLHAPIVRFGYTVTGHKSQGGEWKFVWVDYVFGANPASEYFFRWAYTATTRASECLHAVCPPAVDTLAAVLGGGGTAIPSSVPASSSSSPLALGALLVREGLKISALVELDWCKRVFVSRGDMPVGHVDLRYRKTGLVSAVDVRMPAVREGLRSELATLAGRNIQVVMGRASSPDPVSAPLDTDDGTDAAIERLPDAYRSVIRRLRIAVAARGMTLRDVQAKTQWQVRLELDTPRGGGYFDLYFKGNGRLTYCQRGTMCPEDFADMQNALGAG